ncbi:MAG: hypothetical protein V1787_05775 [Candidatus Micrarchaeota archaeon]
MKREDYIKRAKKTVQKELSRKDLHIIQAVRTVDDLDEAKALLYERLLEWFKSNFPDVDLQNEESLCRIVAEFGAKEYFEYTKLEEVVGEKRATELLQKAEASYGASFDIADRNAVASLAKGVLSLIETRAALESYISKESEALLKNVSYLTDPLLAARLLQTAGSLARLASMPASTLQVMGAEKALFKHLRTGSRPPKHGIIFQSNLIRGAPLKQRGKIARALSTKLSIAAKADFFTQHFIADKLKADLEKRLKAIRS